MKSWQRMMYYEDYLNIAIHVKWGAMVIKLLKYPLFLKTKNMIVCKRIFSYNPFKKLNCENIVNIYKDT